MTDYNLSAFPDFDPDDVVKSEVIEHVAATNERSAVRRIALQILYEVDSAGHPANVVLAQHRKRQQFSSKSQTYLRQIVTGVVENGSRIDRVIQHYAPEWPLNQVAIVDRNILRMAVFEFAIYKRIPVKTAIDEAVELAKLFGADSTPRFVNGVLGALSDDPETVEKMLNIEGQGMDE